MKNRTATNETQLTKALIISLIISLFVTIILGFVLNYFVLPPWNIHSAKMWIFLFFMIIILGVVCLINYNLTVNKFSKKSNHKQAMLDAKEERSFKMKISFVIIVGVFMIIFMIALLAGSEMFNASKYSSIIETETSDWNTDMTPIQSVDNIALMDTDTAKVFGERTLGSLSDIVSQYDLAQVYTQINYQGKPMKVAPLEYDSFWKWCSNTKDGIPGYIMVDPVNTEAKFIRLEKSIKYSPSERFGRDLARTIRRQYPTALYSNAYFEVDEQGNPYWIIPTEETTIGLFGGVKINGCIILDACTGESNWYKPDDIPEWVDVVYDGDYISERVNWNGMLKNGFWNSLFSAKGCTKCTDDYGYVTIGNDIWIYTGITSATADSSNVGVILANERTCEIKYYEIAGADEKSAMAAAEGEVQQYGYTASFPSIINVNGEATYIMVLKDANNIVKEYAMVNVANYSKVVVADTQKEVFSKYAEKIGMITNNQSQSNSATEATGTANNDNAPENENLISKEITVQNIQYIVSNGNTTAYISDIDGKVYKAAFDEYLILVKTGDKIEIKVPDSEATEAITPIRKIVH